jgi:hypothetical protein
VSIFMTTGSEPSIERRKNSHASARRYCAAPMAVVMRTYDRDEHGDVERACATRRKMQRDCAPALPGTDTNL